MDRSFFFNAPDDAALKTLHITQCGYERCSPGHFYNPNLKDIYLIHYIMDGKGIFTVNGVTYNLTKDRGFLILPGQNAYYRADDTDPWFYYWVGFKGIEAGQILARCGLDSHSPPILTDEQIFKDSIKKLVHEGKSTGHDQLNMLSALFRAFYGLSSRHRRHTANTQTSAQLTFALEYIADNYSQDISISDISKQAYVDRSYLYKLFIKELGTSPVQYLINYRITQSKNLLLYTGHSVTDIAMFCGFKSAALYCKIFKKHTGKTPLEFRKQGQSHDNAAL